MASFGVPALGEELAQYRMLCEPQAVAFYDDCSSVDVYRCSDGTIFYDYVEQDIGDRYGVIYGRDYQLQSLVVGEFDYRLDQPYKEIEVTEIEDQFSLNELLETGSETSKFQYVFRETPDYSWEVRDEAMMTIEESSRTISGHQFSVASAVITNKGGFFSFLVTTNMDLLLDASRNIVLSNGGRIDSFGEDPYFLPKVTDVTFAGDPNFATFEFRRMQFVSSRDQTHCLVN